MKMKKYTASTMVDAMAKVREDFGDDAIILSSNVTKTKGFLGLFRKRSVEVVASYDKTNAERIYESRVHSVQPIAETESVEQIEQEMREIKQMLKDIQPVDRAFEKYPDELLPILKKLQMQGVESKYITEIGNLVFNRMKQDKIDFTEEQQMELIRTWFSDQLHDIPFGGITYQKQFINVLGPTGVGKTTTIAKIAARALLEEKKKVGFITTDTYRIAAIEQLRTYANLLQAPVEIVYSEEDFRTAIEKLKDLDLIFIDTAGRNYKEAKFVDDLSKLIDFSLDMETFLVLSTTSKEQDMDTIIRQFTNFPIEKFIFTKTDETDSVGSIINLILKYGIGVSYYTDGQEVPEDLTEASLEKIVDLLLAGDSHA
ncbi:flagellar biosynthesis protein FlhF [Sporosarcina sp. P18a]|uniref:flagellar biosynthesis protein FlhF n=1 Tax=unclassified Sporosarcina TaxID=2647733 RepID=UPI000C172846|nr:MULTISPECIES: flagellar biosynthesis protein FlhF [unclassified Sporosarcina]PIC81383.1 flagellar biosynthesis protein FlhF [Sporosarcina sp. P18a]PID02800.1 flagellar biosynthesis protein FlhF [Sporosarcina sp. P2]PID25586.1 flagellar biosynthesis protein FlhF [Sporosarcina sp. P7]